MNPEDQAKVIFDVLKQHLRESGIPYRELASRMEMSEANVKRIFSAESCSIEQLLRFCAAADLKFFDLMAVAARADAGSFRISNEAETYFFDHFDCFVFFRAVSTARSLDEALAKSTVPKENLRRFLKDLERLELIDRTKRGYVLRHKGYLSLSRTSKLRRKLEERWTPWFLSRILSKRDDQQHSIELFSTGLSEAHRGQLIEDLNRVLEKYREIGVADQGIGQRAFSPVAVCVGIGPYRVGLFDS